MVHWKNRLRAFLLHLAISLFFSALAALLVFGIWYPYPYRYISGGRELFLLVIAVDVVMGPIITMVIFNRSKTYRHLFMDFTIIGLLQVAALLYGLWAVFSARPVHLVFEYYRVAVVHAADVDQSTLIQAPPSLQSLPLNGPTLLSLRPFKGGNEEFDSTMAALGGVSQAAQPALWQPWDAARVEILKASRPAIGLKQRFTEQASQIDDAIVATGRAADHLRYLPLLSRKQAWTVLIDAQTTVPVGFLPLDSF